MSLDPSRLKTFALDSPCEKDEKTCYSLGENMFKPHIQQMTSI